MRWLDSLTNPMNMNLSKLQGIGKEKEIWCIAVHGVTKSWTQLRDWTTNYWLFLIDIGLFNLSLSLCKFWCPCLSSNCPTNRLINIILKYSNTPILYEEYISLELARLICESHRVQSKNRTGDLLGNLILVCLII